ncbi:hypothetical protein [Microcoleus sp. FACHB-68]|nr:hypothetical protein [Microcoleus sp. FACHB-68]
MRNADPLLLVVAGQYGSQNERLNAILLLHSPWYKFVLNGG